MSKHSDEYYREIRAKIRKLLQIRPNVTAREISKVFEIPYKMALRELAKVRREIIEDLKQATSEKDLAEFAELITQANPEIKHIIFDRDENGNYTHSAKERTFAYSALITGNERLLNLKMDLGQYQRNIGKITVASNLTPEQEKILTKALNYAVQRADNAGDGANQGEPEIASEIGEK